MNHIRISLLVAFALSPALPAQSDDPIALTQRAVQAQQSGDYATAEKAYRALLQLRPDEVAAHVNLGVVLVDLGRYDEAIAEYAAADKLLPGDPRIALNIALAYEKSGRISEAAKRLASLHQASPQDIKITLLLADCYLQSGENARVIELLQPIETQNTAGLDKSSDDLGFAYLLGTALIRLQRIPEGQVFLDRILRNGDTAQARFLLGTRMFESGDYPAAVNQFAAAVELDANLPELQSFYGQALLATGDPDAAETAFRKELSRNPADFPANLELGEILTVRKQFVAAKPFLERALALRPQSADAELALGQCLSGTQDLQMARPHLELAVKYLPDSLEAHEALRGVYQGLHLNAEAAREAATARKLLQIARAKEPGPKVNDLSPDFELPTTDPGRQVRLRDLYARSGAVLVFGSYTCPNFRSSAGALKNLHRQYGASVPFLLVYIREAHASGNWQSTRNRREDVEIAPAANLSDKQQHAVMCSRQLHLPFPAVVDTISDTVETAYAAWPSRLFVIAKNGRVLYSTRLTELDFRPHEIEAVLRQMSGPAKGI
ncbi:MAG: tetratricopeptide repeat protein [Bryobacteraceae bacterium]